VSADIERGTISGRDRVDGWKQQEKCESIRQARVEGLVWRACGERVWFFSVVGTLSVGAGAYWTTSIEEPVTEVILGDR
jgi:hypothetical protein